MAKKTAPTPILMPKAKALWLYDNTMLNLEQIAEFTQLHLLDVKAIADGEGSKVTAQSPVIDGDLTHDEIERCEKDSDARLQRVIKNDRPSPTARAKGPRYTPVAKRADKPNAILYLIKNNPELIDAQIVRLVGTTKNTIKNIRDKTHADFANLSPRHPVEAGLCTLEEYNKDVEKARKARPEQVIEDKSSDQFTPSTKPKDDDNGTDSSFDFSAFLNAGRKEASGE